MAKLKEACILVITDFIACVFNALLNSPISLS